jgi:hypothetical protein
MSASNDIERYVALSDVPKGNGDFSDEDTKEALSDANGQLEGDVNEGRVIEDPDQIHADAANAWASYLLYLPFDSPDEATLGDAADGGDAALEYADRYSRIYDRKVNTINAAAGDEGEGDSDEVRSGVL